MRNPFLKIRKILGNPLEWTYVDKVILLILIHIIVYLPFIFYLFFSIYFPSLIPKYISISLIPRAFRSQLVLFLIYIFLFFFAIWKHRQQLECKWLAYIFSLLISTHGALILGAVGYATNPLTFLTIFLQALIGIFFFDLLFSLLSIFSWTAILGIHVIFEKMEIIRYAILLIEAPFVEGQLDLFWLLWNMCVGSFLIIIAFSLCVYIINRWRERELKVRELSDLLKEMFGRYLSTEVMHSIIQNPASLELGGERRKVTIMITDLRGFTSLSENIEPEKVVQMLNNYFEVMVDVILKYDGTINEIIGDSLLVIFGAPQLMNNRAEKAIACSIDMQNAMLDVNKQNQELGFPEIEMGIGLNEAEVVVGNIGSSKRSKYAVVGSGVNLTSRIESYTVGGQIFISESLKNDVKSSIHIKSRKEVTPKGSDTPIGIYEVVGIANPYNVVILAKDSQLQTLGKEISFKLIPVEDKNIGKKNIYGSFCCLSKKGGECILDEPVEIFSDIKLNLINVEDDLKNKDFYCKVIEMVGNEFNRYIVRFTGVPIEINTYFQAHREYAATQESELK